MSGTSGWDAAQEAGDPNPVERIGASILDQVLGKASARMVYGDPVQHGDRTVIPVARISARFGFGGGGGRTNFGNGPESGSGGGGGGTLDAKPIGYIELTAHGSEYHTIEDTTQIAMTAIRIGGVVVVLIVLRLLFLRRKKKSQAAAAVVELQPRRRWLRRTKGVVEVVPEPSEPADERRRWRLRAA